MIKFIHGADMLIHDTQYTEEEYEGTTAPVRGFGHSTYAMAPENAKKAGVKYLFPFHCNPHHSDADLDTVYKKIRYPQIAGTYYVLRRTFRYPQGRQIACRETVPQGFAKRGVLFLRTGKL